jgi:hypothetical protein
MLRIDELGKWWMKKLLFKNIFIEVSPFTLDKIVLMWMIELKTCWKNWIYNILITYLPPLQGQKNVLPSYIAIRTQGHVTLHNLWCSNAFHLNGMFISAEMVLELKNDLLDLNNSSNLSRQLDGAPVHFAHIVCDCLSVNFPCWFIWRRGWIAWPSLYFLGLWKTRCTAKEWTQWTQSMNHCSNCKCYIGCYRASSKRWTVGRTYAELQMVLTV